MNFDTKDSGSRREFATGSVRDAATGKGRYDLVSPIALERLAQLYERGAVKYAARNWEKGQPISVFMDCAMRHLQKHLRGERDEDHLAAAAWNVFAAIHVEHQAQIGALPAELLDLPDYGVQNFRVRARVTVQDVDSVWITTEAPTIELARLRAEMLRRSGHSLVTIEQGGRVLQISIPGDPPMADVELLRDALITQPDDFDERASDVADFAQDLDDSLFAGND